MVILYCEKCGQRISEADLQSGKARESADQRALCPQCASAEPAPKPGRRRSGSGFAVVSPEAVAHPAGAGHARAPSASHHNLNVPVAPPSNPRLAYSLVVGGVAGGLVLLGLVALLLTSRSEERSSGQAKRSL